jgi:hypothetical protein
MTDTLVYAENLEAGPCSIQSRRSAVTKEGFWLRQRALVIEEHRPK